MVDCKIYLFPVDRIKKIRIKEHDYDRQCRCGTCITISLKRIADEMLDMGVSMIDLEDEILENYEVREDKDDD